MDNSMFFVLNIIMFTFSALTDLLILSALFFLFWKIFKIKGITIENNQEIYEHDKTISKLAQEVEEIKQG